MIENLNAAQQQAVLAEDGPVLVLAGPGSGKTRVLTHRVAYLIQARGVSPFSILAVTFTNKAAREMKERLTQMLGEEKAANLAMGTFHSICARFLRRDIGYLQRRNDFVIYDADDQERLMRRVIQQLNLSEKQYSPYTILARVSKAKNRLVTPDQFALEVSGSTDFLDTIVAKCYPLYQDLLFQNNALDFDDLLVETVRLFREHPNVLEEYQQRYSHILIDEYQDTNHAQYMLVKLLAAKHHRLFVVGDDDQAIYTWRGADRENILRFERDYPEAQIFVLDQNYRSTRAILDVAQAIIRGNAGHLQKKKLWRLWHRKKLWTENAHGEPVVLAETYDENDEAFQVVGEIHHLITGWGYQAGDIAIMYRTNAQSRVFEETFINYNIPYRVVGGMRFYDRKEVRDIVAYLRFLFNPHDEVSLERIINVPKRNIGGQTVRILQSLADTHNLSTYQAIHRVVTSETQVPMRPRVRRALAQFLELVEGLMDAREQLNLPDLLSHLLSTIEFHRALLDEYGAEEGEERWQNVQELCRVASQYAEFPRDMQLQAFLEEIALYTDLDKTETEENAVTCITLHQAKGLEFPVVFLVGLEDCLVPHSRSAHDPNMLEEERRLLYVGVTRARELLYLTYATRRARYGEKLQRSRFLENLPDRILIHKINRTRSTLPAPSRDTKEAVMEGKKKSGGEKKTARTRTPLRTGSQRKASEKSSVPSSGNSGFHPGRCVLHERYGEGVIVSCRSVTGHEEVVVHFFGHGQKTLSANFSELKLLEQ